MKHLFGLAIGAIIISFIIEMMLICTSFARRVPTNYILLLIFTLLEAFIFGHICSFYDTASVITASAITAAVTIALTLYAMFTKTDFTVCGQLFVVLCAVAFLLSIMSFFVSYKSPMHPFISGVFAIIYGLYLIVDTQMVLGKGEYSLSVDDYVVGALIIYVDIMMLFLQLLSIFGDRS
jgi:hypothetical protein